MKNEEFATALRIVFLTQMTQISQILKKNNKNLKKTIKTTFCVVKANAFRANAISFSL